MTNNLLPFLLSALALTASCAATEVAELDEASLDTTRAEVPALSRTPATTGVLTRTARGEATDRARPDAELVARVVRQFASVTSGFARSICAPSCAGGAGGPGQCPPGSPVCCFAQDQCGALTDAACQQFCAQNGVRVPPPVACDGATAWCVCCQP